MISSLAGPRSSRTDRRLFPSQSNLDRSSHRSNLDRTPLSTAIAQYFPPKAIAGQEQRSPLLTVISAIALHSPSEAIALLPKPRKAIELKVTIGALSDGFYNDQVFTGDQAIVSPTFIGLRLTADQILKTGR